MLVLTRKVGQRIHIGHNVVVTVTAIEGAKVRIGVTAPDAVGVWRSELYEQLIKDAPETLCGDEAADAAQFVDAVF